MRSTSRVRSHSAKAARLVRHRPSSRRQAHHDSTPCRESRDGSGATRPTDGRTAGPARDVWFDLPPPRAKAAARARRARDRRETPMTTPEVPDSPLVALLSALGHRDVGAAEALCPPGCQIVDRRWTPGAGPKRRAGLARPVSLRSAFCLLPADGPMAPGRCLDRRGAGDLRDAGLAPSRTAATRLRGGGRRGWNQRGAGLRRQRAAAGATTGPPTSHSALEAISSCPSEISSLAVPRATRRPTPIGEVVSSQPGHPPGRGRSREFPASGHTWRRVIASSGSTMTSGA